VKTQLGVILSCDCLLIGAPVLYIMMFVFGVTCRVKTLKSEHGRV
jgi:hypothetical protein